MNDGGSAFPIPNDPSPGAYPAEPGMSLLDYFAGQAMLAWSRARIEQTVDDLDRDDMAAESYHDAAAMLRAREKYLRITAELNKESK